MDVRADLDWSLMASFLAAAETGSLSAAATTLRQSQPTVGRHIRKLESQLGLELFQRHARGLVLTPSGERIRHHAQAMQAAMAQVALEAEAETGTLSGTVRIACSFFAAHHVLPGLVAQMRAVEPQISVVLHPSDNSDNLMFREADIALRMYRPRQLDLVTRHIADIEMGAFAAKGYLARRGVPRSYEDLLSHDVVGYDQSPLMRDVMAQMGYTLSAEQFVVRTDNQTAYWELVRAGCGVGFTQAHVGRSDPALEELHLGFDIPALPMWLTAHETVRKTPRVDRVWDLLVEHLPSCLA